jgi:hypothetical protein
LCNDCLPYSPRYAQYAPPRGKRANTTAKRLPPRRKRAKHHRKTPTPRRKRATHHRKTWQTRIAPTLHPITAQYAPPRRKRANTTAKRLPPRGKRGNPSSQNRANTQVCPYNAPPRCPICPPTWQTGKYHHKTNSNLCQLYPHCRGRPACLPLCGDCLPYSPRYAQYAALHCRATHHRKTGQTHRFAPTLHPHVAQYAPPRGKRANITAQYAPPRCEWATVKVAPTLCCDPVIQVRWHDCRGDLHGRPCAVNDF